MVPVSNHMVMSILSPDGVDVYKLALELRSGSQIHPCDAVDDGVIVVDDVVGDDAVEVENRYGVEDARIAGLVVSPDGKRVGTGAVACQERPLSGKCGVASLT